jgi:hypothetical protein
MLLNAARFESGLNFPYSLPFSDPVPGAAAVLADEIRPWPPQTVTFI